jgi:branched-chain amino acid transport system permease protein
MLYLLQICIDAATLACVAVAYDLVFGYMRRFSAAPIAFYGIGAYGGAWILLHTSDQFVAGALGAFLISAAIGWVVGRATLHLQGDYFIVATLAVAFAAVTVMEDWQSVTGGFIGLSHIPYPTFGNWTAISTGQILLVTLATLALTVLVCWRLVSSPVGRILRAVGDDDQVVNAMGQNASSRARNAFALSAGLSGLAGALFASQTTFIDPTSFGLDSVVIIVAVVIIGGVGTTFGALAGALTLVAVPEILNALGLDTNASGAYAENAIYGVVVIILGGFFRGGLLRPRKYQVPSGTVPADSHGQGGEAEPKGLPAFGNRAAGSGEALHVEGMQKRFGGLTAVDDVTMCVEPGHVVAVIGPNGAGKSTLLGCISGTTRPDVGRVYVGEHQVSGRPAYRIAQNGITLMFQQPRLFPSLTVVENLLIAMPRRKGMNMAAVLASRRGFKAEDRALCTQAGRLLGWVGMADRMSSYGESLSYGQQKLVALSRAAARNCPVVLLDEPSAGVSPGLMTELARLIKELAASGAAVCVVEHNMPLVRAVADRVIVMSTGKVILEAPPEQAMQDQRVREIYLGTSSSATASPEISETTGPRGFGAVDS